VDKLRLSAALGIVAAGVAAYANSFGGAFVFDDTGAILENATLRHASTVLSPAAGVGGGTVLGRPLLNASLGLNWAISDSATWSYHAFNLGVHLAAALLLLALLGRTLPRAAAFAGALVWTVHPLLTEAVTYVVQRAESLAAALTLFTLYALARSVEAPGARSRRTWAIGAVIACFLGMGVKETMYCAPLLAFLYDRAFLSGSVREAWKRRAKLHGALWACLLFLARNSFIAGARGHTVGFRSGIPWAGYVQTQFHVVAHYLRLALWPSPLVFDYGVRSFTGWAVLPAAALVLALLVLTLVGLLRWPRTSFLGCVFFLVLAPTSLVAGNRQTAAEHRMYLPLAAAAALAAAGSAEAARRRCRAAPYILAAAALPLALATHHRNHAYASDLTLYRDSTVKLPDSAFNHFDLAYALKQRGDLAGAESELRRTLELDPNIYHANTDLGDVLRGERKWSDAAQAYQAALALDPNDAAVRFHLGQVRQAQGRAAEAAEQFNDAGLLDPTYREAASSR
jgi:Flp pilus assembly protein TadD